MKQLPLALLTLLVAGCGSDAATSRAVTPVMADTRGTYRLAASSVTVTDETGGVTFNSYSAGTLRLTQSSYTRSVSDRGERTTGGLYLLGSSINTILNSRHGSFSLTSTEPPYYLTGTYQVLPDLTLIFTYDDVALPDRTLMTRTETWIKESDSPRH